ncbi:hypothetical protein AB0I60_26580 [Actinosynnema sp. NPDC050436]|uniref:hypothetical protein n=1 Tax=Actinosynnema sp. NPDC050436 TaxID=3155659 RepID=UPI0033C69392
MRLLERERAELERLLPGLDAALAGARLEELERPGSAGLAAFREAGGPGLLVPAEHQGTGADLPASVAGRCVEALGGVGFIGSGDIAYRNSACRAPAFRLPFRTRMSAALLEHAAGEPLRVP